MPTRLFAARSDAISSDQSRVRTGNPGYSNDHADALSARHRPRKDEAFGRRTNIYPSQPLAQARRHIGDLSSHVSKAPSVPYHVPSKVTSDRSDFSSYSFGPWARSHRRKCSTSPSRDAEDLAPWDDDWSDITGSDSKQQDSKAPARSPPAVGIDEYDPDQSRADLSPDAIPMRPPPAAYTEDYDFDQSRADMSPDAIPVRPPPAAYVEDYDSDEHQARTLPDAIGESGLDPRWQSNNAFPTTRDGAKSDQLDRRGTFRPSSRPSTPDSTIKRTGEEPVRNQGLLEMPPASMLDAAMAFQAGRPVHLTVENIPAREKPYIARVRRLTDCMPHLVRVISSRSQSENKSAGWITRFEYAHNTNEPQRETRKKFDFNAWQDDAKFAAQLSIDQNMDAFLRVLLVEDLSHSLMDALGSRYKVDPEAFAEHLWVDHEALSDMSDRPSRWVTAKMQKSYKSIKWYRPVQIEPKVLAWLQSPADRKKLTEDGIRWSETEYTREGPYLLEEATEYHVKIDTNIFRRVRPLSTRPRDSSRIPVQATWEERATVFMHNSKRLDTMIILLDPLPVLQETKVVTKTQFQPRSSLGRSTFLKSLYHGKNTSKGLIPVFTPLAPRRPTKFPTNKLEATHDHMSALASDTLNATASSTDLESWIWESKDKNTGLPGDPLVAILRLAYIDTVDYLDHLGWTLDEISRDSLDETILTERLPAWRKLLKELEIEVPALGKSLRDFIGSDHAAFAEAQTMINDLDIKRIPDFLDRVYAVHAALRSEMALLDSSRSIAEARTVARLTELAFLFIPLTFAASIFSMQVTELQASISFWVFIATAIGVSAFTYSMRAAMQSGTLQHIHRRAADDSATRGSSPAAKQTSTYKLARYLIKRVWRHSVVQMLLSAVVFLLALVLPTIPIAWMWMRMHSDVALNVMVTLLILPMGIVMAWHAKSAFDEAMLPMGGDGNEVDSTDVIKLSGFDRMALRFARMTSSKTDASRSRKR